MNKKTAVIIGAGPAGLTVAYELLKHTDYKPIIIELDSQVGGLSKTVDYKGNKIDIGGHRFFSKSERVINWWLKFLPFKTSDENVSIKYQNKEAVVSNSNAASGDTDKVMLLRSRKSRILYQRKFFDYPLSLNFKTLNNLGLFKVFKVGCSYIYAKLFPVNPEENLSQFFRNRFGKELYLTFFKDYTEKVWGVPCEKIPADWGRQRVKDLNITKLLTHAVTSLFVTNKSLDQKGTSTSLIEQFMYPMYGPGQMWDTVADKIKELGGEILLNTEVSGINFSDSTTVSSVNLCDLATKEYRTIDADIFFSTMPVRTLIRNAKGIEIPEEVRAIANGLEYRDFLIVGLLLDKLLLKDDEKSKSLTDNWIYLQDNNIKAGRVQIFNNWSPGMVTDKDKVWIGVEYFCNKEEEFWQQSDKAIADQAIDEMQLIGLVSKSDVIDSVVLKVHKAYPSYYGSYDKFDELKKFFDPISNLYLIGRNGMHKYNNSDHSMLTAMVAVDNIKNGIVSKKDIWDVNTEEEYHEEKTK
jgi:protoporphyrinogen oxidase